jgi:hypothetical protein
MYLYGATCNDVGTDKQCIITITAQQLMQVVSLLEPQHQKLQVMWDVIPYSSVHSCNI